MCYCSYYIPFAFTFLGVFVACSENNTKDEENELHRLLLPTTYVGQKLEKWQEIQAIDTYRIKGVKPPPP